MKVTSNLGILLLAIYMIVIGLMGLTHMSLGTLSFLVPALALVAGVFLLVGK